jgi:hypothetical protein
MFVIEIFFVNMILYDFVSIVNIMVRSQIR